MEEKTKIPCFSFEAVGTGDRIEQTHTSYDPIKKEIITKVTLTDKIPTGYYMGNSVEVLVSRIQMDNMLNLFIHRLVHNNLVVRSGAFTDFNGAQKHNFHKGMSARVEFCPELDGAVKLSLHPGWIAYPLKVDLHTLQSFLFCFEGCVRDAISDYKKAEIETEIHRLKTTWADSGLEWLRGVEQELWGSLSIPLEYPKRDVRVLKDVDLDNSGETPEFALKFCSTRENYQFANTWNQVSYITTTEQIVLSVLKELYNYVSAQPFVGRKCLRLVDNFASHATKYDCVGIKAITSLFQDHVEVACIMTHAPNVEKIYVPISTLKKLLYYVYDKALQVSQDRWKKEVREKEQAEQRAKEREKWHIIDDLDLLEMLFAYIVGEERRQISMGFAPMDFTPRLYNKDLVFSNGTVNSEEVKRRYGRNQK